MNDFLSFLGIVVLIGALSAFLLGWVAPVLHNGSSVAPCTAVITLNTGDTVIVNSVLIENKFVSSDSTVYPIARVKSISLSRQ